MIGVAGQGVMMRRPTLFSTIGSRHPEGTSLLHWFRGPAAPRYVYARTNG